MGCWVSSLLSCPILLTMKRYNFLKSIFDIHVLAKKLLSSRPRSLPDQPALVRLVQVSQINTTFLVRSKKPKSPDYQYDGSRDA